VLECFHLEVRDVDLTAPIPVLADTPPAFWIFWRIDGMGIGIAAGVRAAMMRLAITS
jgi:hypothetical protein